MMARYYMPVTGAQLLGDARTGAIAYLRSRGIENPQLPSPKMRSTGVPGRDARLDRTLEIVLHAVI
jgi:hypothetical protein